MPLLAQSQAPTQLFITFILTNRKLSCFKFNFASVCADNHCSYTGKVGYHANQNRAGMGTRLYSLTSIEFKATEVWGSWPSLHMWIWQTSPWPPAAAQLHDLSDDGVRRLGTLRQGHRWLPLRELCTFRNWIQLPSNFIYFNIIVCHHTHMIPSWISNQSISHKC